MTIKPRKSLPKRPVIDLSGPQGNAFALLGLAKQYAKQLDLPIDDIRKEMMSGNYEHLVEVFDKYFGEFVDIYR